MAKTWNQGICNEKSGFLFSHECFLASAANCSRCQKPVCQDHSHEIVDHPGDFLCTSCTKKDLQRHPGKSRGASRSSRPDHDDYDEPYFYGGYYYGSVYYDNHYGSRSADPNDFTEADAESLTSEMDEGFESDMSES